MIDAVIVLLTTWLAVWLLLMAGYLALWVALDWLRARWRQCQRTRQYRRNVAVELVRIDRDVAVSVERINSAFVVAQRLIRDRADTERQRRTS